MGMTLPLLVRATVSRGELAGRTISYLYGANAMGAAIGAATTPWVLVSFLGIRGAVGVGAAMNLCVGLGAWLLLRGTARGEPAPLAGVELTDVREVAAPPDPHARLPMPIWALLYGLSGFLALGLEMIWFRVLDVAIKSSSVTYGTVLALFLAGFSSGCLLAGFRASRISRPLRGFLGCQCGTVLYTGLAIGLIAYGPSSFPPLRALIDYWGQYEGVTFASRHEWKGLLALYVALPWALFLVPTLLMGASFTFLQRAVQDDPRTSGRKVGLLQASNILGSTLGSMIVGLALLSRLGTMGSLRVLLAAGMVFAVLGVQKFGLRSGFSVSALLIAVVVTLLPDGKGWWPRLHGADSRVLQVAEDASGVSVIAPHGDVHHVWFNGKGQSSIPFAAVHIKLGALPAIVHPRPVDVAVVGLGSGGTAFAANCRPETVRLRVFEICGSQLGLLQEFGRLYPQNPVRQILDSPRLDIVHGDGRNAIARGVERYDIIEADALRPNSAYSGNLYSVEFFRTCARRLKPGGLVCTWAPTLATRRAFCDVFPHVVTFDVAVLIGSETRIEMDQAAWRQRALSPETSGWLGADSTQAVLAELVSCVPYSRNEIAAVEPNCDLFPRDEYESARFICLGIVRTLRRLGPAAARMIPVIREQEQDRSVAGGGDALASWYFDGPARPPYLVTPFLDGPEGRRTQEGTSYTSVRSVSRQRSR
jgi:hypothetical protein